MWWWGGAFEGQSEVGGWTGGVRGVTDECGSVAAGYYGSVVAWYRDDVSDPHALLGCYFVMKDGVVLKAEQDI